MARSVRALREWLATLADDDVIGIPSDDPETLVEYESYLSDGETRWFEVGAISELWALE